MNKLFDLRKIIWVPMTMATFILGISCNIKEKNDIYFGKYIFEDAKLSNSMILDIRGKTIFSTINDSIVDNYSIEDLSIIKKGNEFNLRFLGKRLESYNEQGIVHVFESAVSSRLYFDSKEELAKDLKNEIWEESLTKLDKNESLLQRTYYQFGDSLLRKYKKYYLSEELIYSEVEIFGYSIIKHKSYYFITIKSNNVSSNFSVILQIRGASRSTIELSGSKDFGFFHLKKSQKKINNLLKHLPIVFSVCNEDYVGQYYYKGISAKFLGGAREIKKMAMTSISSSNKVSDTGNVTIRFLINCEGKTGRFSILQTDKNYEPTTLSKNLVKQLFEFTSKLSNWSLERNVENGNSFDNYKYLTFKIKNGEIIEVLP